MLRSAAFLAFGAMLSACSFGQGWLCYGGNAQHSGQFIGTSQTAAIVKWQASLDDGLSNFGGATLTHFAAPMVTPGNTVVHGFRFTTQGASGPVYDNWRVVARSGVTGQEVWHVDTDYSTSTIWPSDWTSVFPVTLFQAGGPSLRGMAAAGGGGSILVRKSADAATSMVTRFVFYTTVDDYNQNAAAFAPIKINTPLTADNAGNIYFGYMVTGSVPPKASSLGTGGVVKVNTNTGAAIFKAVKDLGVSPQIGRTAINEAPALTTDSKYIYVGVCGGGGGSPFLVKLATKDLSTAASVELKDPSVNGDVRLINESSGSPMIGPDGHVFLGVFGNQYRESHGWMLQYDANLKATDSKGKRWPTGAFGWDDTASVVPANIVPSYKGKASYLLLTKYNNYDFGGNDGGDGSNHIAVLDPTSDSITRDRQSPTQPVMNEVLLVLGPTKTNSDSSHPDARNEWCINAAAIDVNSKSAIINSEDGHMYRWSFVTNTLVEDLGLQNPTGEAYTETCIGPDGQLYAINNSILFAIGVNKATSVSVTQGIGAKGGVASLYSADKSTYSVTSVSASGGQAAGVEADFTLNVTQPSTLNIAVDISAVSSVQGVISVYNYVTKTFDLVTAAMLTSSMTFYRGSVTDNVSEYIGPKGKVRVLVQAALPNATSKNKFTLSADVITCSAS